jgi:hypothetical protein
MGALRGTWSVTRQSRQALCTATLASMLCHFIRGDQIAVGPARPIVGLSRPQQLDGLCLASRGVLVF